MLKLVALAIESYQALRKMKKYEGEEINDVAVNEDHGGEENSGVSGESVSETQGDDGQYSDTDGPELTVESEEMNEEEEQEEASARQEHAVKSNEPEGVIGINTEELVGNEEQYVLEKEEQPNEVTQKSKPDVVAEADASCWIPFSYVFVRKCRQMAREGSPMPLADADDSVWI